MNQPAEIILHLQNVDDIFLTPAGPLYCRRLLNSNTEEFIVEEATDLPRHASLNLTVQVPAEEIKRADEVVRAIRTHFGYCRQKSQKSLRNTLQLGWRSLLIAFVFLIIMYFLTKAIAAVLPEGGLAMTLHESLIILGWVALWRPAELLLYEWRPLKREANLFCKIEYSNVKVISDEKRS